MRFKIVLVKKRPTRRVGFLKQFLFRGAAVGFCAAKTTGSSKTSEN